MSKYRKRAVFQNSAKFSKLRSAGKREFHKSGGFWEFWWISKSIEFKRSRLQKICGQCWSISPDFLRVGDFSKIKKELQFQRKIHNDQFSKWKNASKFVKTRAKRRLRPNRFSKNRNGNGWKYKFQHFVNYTAPRYGQKALKKPIWGIQKLILQQCQRVAFDTFTKTETWIREHLITEETEAHNEVELCNWARHRRRRNFGRSRQLQPRRGRAHKRHRQNSHNKPIRQHFKSTIHKQWFGISNKRRFAKFRASDFRCDRHLHFKSQDHFSLR